MVLGGERRQHERREFEGWSLSRPVRAAGENGEYDEGETTSTTNAADHEHHCWQKATRDVYIFLVFF